MTERNVSRRHLLLGAGSAFAAPAALAACSGSTSGGGVSATVTAELRGTTLEYWSAQAPTVSTAVAVEKILDSFNRQNTYGITVQTASAVTNLEKLIGALAAGTPPDLTIYQNFNLSSLYAKGGLADVEATLKGNADWRKVREALYPNIAHGLTWKGKLMGVPTYSGGQLMYYSPAALGRAGLPPPPRLWTWDQFEDYAKKAARPPDVWGYVFGWQYSDLGNLVLNNGGRLINEELTKYTLNSAEVIQTVEWQLALAKAGVAPPHDGSATGGYKEVLPQGETVMQPAVSLRIRDWRRQGGISFATAFNPQGPKSQKKQNFAHGATHGFGIFKKDGKRTTAAALATLWMARVDSGLAVAEGGLQTPYRSVVENSEFQAQLKRDTDLWPFYEVMPNLLQFANGPASAEERASIDTQLRAIWGGKVSARDGLNEAQRIAQGLLDESLR